ncbi:MAG TPA: polysaccharide biosynthesis/export family protein [Verrucomicrobiae bacterium]|jgi:protein involved in polysaccharide export with SLBB domain
MKHLTCLILLLVLAAGCRTRGPSFDPLSPESLPGAEAVFTPATVTNRIDKSLLAPSTDPYRLGPGDVIEVEVIGEAKSQVSLAVGPDGKVYYSLLPGTLVWGLSLAEARALLQKEMAKYTRAMPELVINLRGVASKRMWLLGAVPSPGVYTLASPTTLLDALLSSGGGSKGGEGDETANLLRMASQRNDRLDGGTDLSRSFVLRNGKRLPVDFDRLLRQGDLSQNIYLEADDFVFVRPSELPNVYLLGAVGAQIIPYSRDLTLAGAVISAGGAVKYSMPSRVAIVRGGLTEPMIAEVDYQAIVTGRAKNVRLEPGDIIYVPYSPLRRVAQLAEDILDQFVRTVAVNEGTRLIDDNSRPVGIAAPIGGGGGINTPGNFVNPTPTPGGSQ